jgi:hypothetical protein
LVFLCRKGRFFFRPAIVIASVQLCLVYVYYTKASTGAFGSAGCSLFDLLESLDTGVDSCEFYHKLPYIFECYTPDG